MALSDDDLSRACAALAPLEGALLQEVYQPAPDRLILSLWRPGAKTLLLIVFRGDHTRIHPIERRPPNPREGSAFQQRLRKELSGPLTHFTRIGGDRIVDLRFGALGLRAELTGRHGNLFLLSGETILAAALPNLSRRRTLAPGSTYQGPQGDPPKRSPPSPFPAALVGDALLSAMATHFDGLEADSALESRRRVLLSRVRGRLKKITRLLTNLEGDMTRAAGAADLRRYADLIQIHLGELRRGQPSLVVPDLFVDPPEPIEIPLDPALSPKANMARYYHQARRFEGAADAILARAEAAEEERIALEALQIALTSAPDEAALDALESTAPAPRRPQRAHGVKGAPPRLPFHRFVHNSTGQEFRVGRGAKDNDALTFRHSKGNDVWMHIRGAPGAHVTLPGAGPSPSLETLLDGAALALKYGGQGVGDDGEVSYTRVKHVQRAPGGVPGRVTYSQEKTLYLRITQERLDALERVD